MTIRAPRTIILEPASRRQEAFDIGPSLLRAISSGGADIEPVSLGERRRPQRFCVVNYSPATDFCPIIGKNPDFTWDDLILRSRYQSPAGVSVVVAEGLERGVPQVGIAQIIRPKGRSGVIPNLIN